MRMGCGTCGREWYVGEPRTCVCDRQGGLSYSTKMTIDSDNELKIDPQKSVPTSYAFTDTRPKFVGHYRLGGATGLWVHLTKKPIWLHRKMMKWGFGWEWVDGVNKGANANTA